MMRPRVHRPPNLEPTYAHECSQCGKHWTDEYAPTERDLCSYACLRAYWESDN